MDSGPNLRLLWSMTWMLLKPGSCPGSSWMWNCCSCRSAAASSCRHQRSMHRALPEASAGRVRTTGRYSVGLSAMHLPSWGSKLLMSCKSTRTNFLFSSSASLHKRVPEGPDQQQAGRSVCEEAAYAYFCCSILPGPWYRRRNSSNLS